MTREEKPQECDGCHYATAGLTRYDDRIAAIRRPDLETAWLCWLCANTASGNAHRYPDQYEGQTAVLHTICYVGNVILAAVAKKP